MDGRLPQLGLLSLIAGLLLFTRLTCPLLEPEEARYAEIPRQMLAEGHFLEPTWHGEPYYHKPPLLYWLVMASYRLFGVHDWAARLVPALASFASVLITWGWGRRAFGPRAGFAAGLILALSARFIYLGRMLTFDPLLGFWVIASLASAHLAIRETTVRWRWWLVSALACGLGLLTKGPVAMVLVLVPVLALRFFDRRSARPSVRACAIYVLLAVAVAAPWYAAMARFNSAAAVDFFWLHNVQRYLDPVDHEEPAWFFLPSLLLGTLPWSLLLIPLGHRLLNRTTPKPPALTFCLVALVWCVAFFSLGGCKRVGYILPALPLLALCLGCTLDQWLKQRALFVPSPLAPLPARGARGAWNPAWPLAQLWVATAATVFVVLFVGVQVWLPAYHRRFALRGQVRRHLMLDNEVFCYPKRWDSLTFYLQRDDLRVFAADQRDALRAALQQRSQTLMFVKTRCLGDFQAALPSSHQFVEIGRQGPTLTVGVVRLLGPS